MLDLKRLRKFLNKDYRDEYLETTVRSSISYQISALRAKFGDTQRDFATKIGKPQSVVSRLESAEYGRVSVQTLLDIAKALNVGLVVRFVDYPTFFRSADHVAPADLAVDDVFESLRKGESHVRSERASGDTAGSVAATPVPKGLGEPLLKSGGNANTVRVALPV